METDYSYTDDGFILETNYHKRWYFIPFDLWSKRYYTKSGILKKNRKQYRQTYR